MLRPLVCCRGRQERDGGAGQGASGAGQGAGRQVRQDKKAKAAEKKAQEREALKEFREAKKATADRQKLRQKAFDLQDSAIFSPLLDDWTCEMCFLRWSAWEKVTGSQSSLCAWLESEDCGHHFCLDCANKELVDAHSKRCPEARQVRDKAAQVAATQQSRRKPVKRKAPAKTPPKAKKRKRLQSKG